MQDLRTAARTPGARLVLAAAAVALFGLLSMHGWGSHAGAHPVPAAPHGMSVTSGAGDMLGFPTATGHVTTNGESRSPAEGHPTGVPTDGQGGDLVDLCVAILSGLILAVALFIARRGIRILRSLIPAWPNPVLNGRDGAPPDLLQLCVIRC
jgi:hypothetical protein